VKTTHELLVNDARVPMPEHHDCGEYIAPAIKDCLTAQRIRYTRARLSKSVGKAYIFWSFSKLVETSLCEKC
jgi:hypothetical protein